MRVTVLCFVILAALAGVSETRAEKVIANQATQVLSRPGERGKVLLTVEEGKGMTVLAKDGRWLKVRVGGRTGYVPRSKVDISDGIARNTRRRAFVDGRGTDRGFNGEAGPDDRVGADALVDRTPDEEVESESESEDAEPEEKSAQKRKAPPKRKALEEEEGDGDEKVTIEEGDGEEISAEDNQPTVRVKKKTVALKEPESDAAESFAATPDTVLYLTGKKQGKYTEVTNDEGDEGYVLTSKLDIEEPEGPGGPRKREIDVRAQLGVTFISQKLTNGGGVGGVPDNYKLSTSAVTLALGGAYTRPYKARYVLGGELAYDYALAVPGVAQEGGGNTGISMHNLKLRLLGGYDLKKKNGMILFARLGLHYQSYKVADVGDPMKNKSSLPSESITAPALGAALVIPWMTQKIALRFSFDAILVGASVAQTDGLKDGDSPGAKGAILGAGITYRWRKQVDITGGYGLSLLSMGFGTPVMGQRMHGGTGNVSRFDQFHAVTVGVSKGF